MDCDMNEIEKYKNKYEDSPYYLDYTDNLFYLLLRIQAAIFIIQYAKER